MVTKATSCLRSPRSSQKAASAWPKSASRVAVIGAAVAVFARGAAELRHGDQGDVLPAVAQVQPEGGQRLAKVGKSRGQLALRSARAHLVDVMIPAAHVGEGHLHAHVGLDELRDLAQAVAKAAFGIIGAGGRFVVPLL